MYNEKTPDDGRCTGDNIGTVNKRPYSAIIHDDLMRLQDIARNIRDKSSQTAGIPEPEDCVDHKEQEPHNFSETIIRELGVLGDILDDIYKDLDRLM